METAIPPKRNRREQREYDKYLYQTASSGRKLFPEPETLEAYRCSLCQNINAFIAAAQVRCIAVCAAVRS